jgi:hypothetical protein
MRPVRVLQEEEQILVEPAVIGFSEPTVWDFAQE